MCLSLQINFTQLFMLGDSCKSRSSALYILHFFLALAFLSPQVCSYVIWF